MFGKDRFQFESPNLVDPGETPPMTPARSGRSSPVSNQAADEMSPRSTTRTLEHHIINTSMEYVDARDSAIRFLNDIEVSPTRGVAPFTAETFHDEDEPLMEEDKGDARLKLSSTHSVSFGRSIHDDSFSYKATASSIPQPFKGAKVNGAAGWHRPSRRGNKLHIPSRMAQQQRIYRDAGHDESESGISRRQCLFLCLAPVVLIVLVIVPLLHLIRDKNQNTDAFHVAVDTPAPLISERMLQTIDMLIDNGISDSMALSVHGTPQYLAALWMADVDPVQHVIPRVNLEDSYYFLQRYVLVLLYYSTGGNETWHNNLDFLSEHHECSWYHSKKFTDGAVYAMGASCRGEDLYVSDLLIPANNLKGKIPSELVQLTHLQLLSLSHNSITGTLPDLHKLSGVKYLDLGSNILTGSIPNWINAWSSLRVLGLENNRFTGTIPETLASLTELVTLDLKKNLLKGNIDIVNRLSELEFLYLGQNSFAGYVDEVLFLVDMPALRELDISNNLFYGDAFPITLLKRSNLQVLDLSGNALRGSIPPAIEKNSILEVLEINANGFTGAIPTSIENLVNLKHLDMQINQFNGTIPDHFVNLHQLTYLAMGENNFTPGPIPAFLSSFTTLRELSLPRCNRVGSIPQWFDIMSNLKFLNLQANQLEGSVPEEVWNLPNLSILLLTDNHLNGTVPAHVSNIQEFEILALSTNNITGKVDPFCAAAKQLDSLSFDCALVNCTTACCNTCCSENSEPDISSCYSKSLMNALGKNQDKWEFKYRSAAYSFSPAILRGTDSVVQEKSGSEAQP